MNRLSVYIIVLMLAVLLSYSGGAGARKGSTVPYRNTIYLPSPPQLLGVPCGGAMRLATIDYWPQESDLHYIALFEAEGSGSVFFSTDTESRVSVTLPATGPPQWYTLDLTPPQADGGLIQLRMGVYAASCAAKGNSGVTIRSLNIFVTP